MTPTISRWPVLRIALCVFVTTASALAQSGPQGSDRVDFFAAKAQYQRLLDERSSGQSARAVLADAIRQGFEWWDENPKQARWLVVWAATQARKSDLVPLATDAYLRSLDLEADPMARADLYRHLAQSENRPAFRENYYLLALNEIELATPYPAHRREVVRAIQEGYASSLASQQRWTEASHAYERVFTEHRDWLDAQRLSRLVHHVARCAGNTEDKDRASLWYERLTTQYPDAFDMDGTRLTLELERIERSLPTSEQPDAYERLWLETARGTGLPGAVVVGVTAYQHLVRIREHERADIVLGQLIAELQDGTSLNLIRASPTRESPSRANLRSADRARAVQAVLRYVSGPRTENSAKQQLILACELFFEHLSDACDQKIQDRILESYEHLTDPS